MMTDSFALADFVARWNGLIRHDLSASESSPLSLSDLLDMAAPEDARRWHDLELGYADPRGAAWLRTAIASRYGGLTADDMVCCNGAQEAVACVMRALLTRDDHAIVVVPIYQPSETVVTGLATATGVPLEHGASWYLDIDRVAAAIRPATKLVLINFPNSPTGASLDESSFAALVTLCRRHGLWLVNDEVYRLSAYHRDEQPRVAAVYEHGISIDAVSKGLGLPGLRVGWVACRDRALLAKVQLAKSALSSCLAAPSEVLAYIALRAEARILARNRILAASNRDVLLDFLDRHAARFGAWQPLNGAFAFVRYTGPGSASAFVTELAHHAGTLLLPSALWRSRLATVPENYLRIGLGRIGVAPGLASIDGYLRETSKRGSRREPIDLACDQIKFAVP